MPLYVYLIAGIVLAVACGLSLISGFNTGKRLAKGKALTVADIKPAIRYYVFWCTTLGPEYAVMKGDGESEPRLYRLNSKDGRVRMTPNTEVVKFERNENGHLVFAEYNPGISKFNM